MVKIGHKIIAVPERSEYVKRLLDRTGISENDVLWDNDHNGCMWNAIRAWKSAIGSGCTHWCVMADDTDVVDGYMDIEKICVERFPDAIWTFYSNELSAKHRAANTPYIRLRGYNIRGIAFLMPVEFIEGYVNLCEHMLSEYRYQRDDATCRIFALLNDIPVMTTIPNLVRSYEIKSAMKGHGITRNSDAWAGYSVSVEQFCANSAKNVLLMKKSVLETHLRPDNPVDIKVREKWNRMKLLKEI